MTDTGTPIEPGFASGTPTGRRGRTRALLLWLVAIALVPVLAFCGLLLALGWRDEIERNEEALLRAAQAIRVALDRELQIGVTALETLRHSPLLAAGDLTAFERQARAVKAQHPHWLGIVLTRPDGQQVMNLAAKPGQPLPNIGHYEVIQAVVRERAPAVSELLVGKVLPVPLVGIDVPVVAKGELAYVLGLSMPASHFQALLEQVPVLPGATASIVDYKDIIVAQTGPGGGAVTRRANALAGIGAGPDGAGIDDANGEPRYRAFSRSRVSSWFTVVSAPQSALGSRAARAFLFLLVGGGALLALTLAGTAFVAQRIARLQRRAEGERAAALEAMQQAQKMEAVGRLTGGIAHDFNNLLAIVANSVSILERSDDPALRRQTVDAVRRAADRGAQLTRQLLAFARRSELQPRSIDLAESLATMQVFLAGSLRSDIRVLVDVPAGVWRVRADPAQLDLAILNLALNARDAMPQGGSITISAANVPAAGEQSADMVAIEVRDTGLGMSGATLERAFEPFFTTKPAGAGSGLGLSQVYGFVKQSGGETRLWSEEGRGTSVTLFLPRAAQEASEAGAATARVTRRASVRLLLVEDDDQVAWTTEMLLRQLKHDVVRVRNAEEAIKTLSQGVQADLVLSDIVMPGRMNGLDLAREVRRAWPHLPVVLATGYAGAAGEAEAARFPVLRKPYSAAELAAAIDAALFQAGSRAA